MNIHYHSWSFRRDRAFANRCGVERFLERIEFIETNLIQSLISGKFRKSAIYNILDINSYEGIKHSFFSILVPKKWRLRCLK